MILLTSRLLVFKFSIKTHWCVKTCSLAVMYIASNLLSNSFNKFIQQLVKSVPVTCQAVIRAPLIEQNLK